MERSRFCGVSTSCVVTTLFLVYVVYSMSSLVLLLYPNQSVLDIIREPEPYVGPSLTPMWSVGESVEVYVYLSLKRGVKKKRSHRRPRSRIADTAHPILLFNTTSRFDEKLSESRCFRLVSETTSAEIDEECTRVQLTSSQFQRLRSGNISAFVHMYVSRNNASHDPKHKRDMFDVTHTQTRNLIRDAVVTREVRVPRYRLLEPYIGTCGCGEPTTMTDSLEEEEESDNSTSSYIAEHWNPLISIRHVVDFSSYPLDKVPPMVGNSLVIRRDTMGYVPVLFDDTLVSTSDKLMVLNDTITSLPLDIKIESSSRARWLLSLLMERSIQMMIDSMGANDRDGDDVRKLVTETNPLFLLGVFTVSMLHMLFDVLAFRSEISFWNGLQSRKGISSRAQATSLISQIVIFIYLYHNESSLLVLGPAGFSIAVGIWKLYRLRVLSGDETVVSDTERYDRKAYFYMAVVLYPLVVAYSTYSLVCHSHEGVFDWALHSAVSYVYVAGFITMTPQLYINYSLKSVTHLPWKMFMYRALNTFIDDLFAFIITMPTMHRLSCFRDDIIFFVYLYQRWIYPVDMERASIAGSKATKKKLKDE